MEYDDQSTTDSSDEESTRFDLEFELGSEQGLSFFGLEEEQDDIDLDLDSDEPEDMESDTDSLAD